MKYIYFLVEEIKNHKWILNWKGIGKVLKELFQRFLKFI